VSDKKVAVVGLGYVGLPVAVLTARKGFKTIGIDLDETKIKAINEGRSPIEDKALIQALKSKPFVASSSFDSISEADIALIAVPTPVKNELPDLTILKNATVAVAEKLPPKSLLIIESTINPGVCDEELIPLIEEKTGKKAGIDYHIAHCPERINPGKVPADAVAGNNQDINFGLETINRVLGSNSDKGLEQSLAFYNAILDAEVKPMASIKEAEAVKVVENSFRDINIAFVNELAMSFHKLGINIENVIDGAATKPYAFMAHRPGAGVGGHCIPVDPYYLIEYASGFGFEHDFLRMARKINSGMPQFTVDLLQEALNEVSTPLKGSTIALLGLSYKSNVDDDRESPAFVVKALLQNLGAKVVAFDPHSQKSSDVDNLDDALKNANAARNYGT